LKDDLPPKLNAAQRRLVAFGEDAQEIFETVNTGFADEDGKAACHKHASRMYAHLIAFCPQCKTATSELQITHLCEATEAGDPMGHVHVVCETGHKGLIGVTGLPGELFKVELVFDVQSATTPTQAGEEADVAELDRLFDLKPPADEVSQ
jgi:hypothetical protein